jgi:GH15 family glucan-1,4-alpha-glucosidase
VTHSCPITLNHGVIGNGRVLALLSPTTHIDWLCMPRFDGASVFGRLLDVERGGTFAFHADCTQVDARMEYAVNTDLAADCDAWTAQYREVILDRPYNAKLGYFAQVPDGRFPDASNLLLPTLGLIDPCDRRFVSTVEAYELLVEDGLMLRYRHKDDFGETTSAFSICALWCAEALAMGGRLEDARRLFERLTTHANCVGLFSEDITPRTGLLLGNLPQAYTHVGVINTAVTISELLEARDARFRAWS